MQNRTAMCLASRNVKKIQGTFTNSADDFHQQIKAHIVRCGLVR